MSVFVMLFMLFNIYIKEKNVFTCILNKEPSKMDVSK